MRGWYIDERFTRNMCEPSDTHMRAHILLILIILAPILITFTLDIFKIIWMPYRENLGNSQWSEQSQWRRQRKRGMKGIPFVSARRRRIFRQTLRQSRKGRTESAGKTKRFRLLQWMFHPVRSHFNVPRLNQSRHLIRVALIIACQIRAILIDTRQKKIFNLYQLFKLK